MISLVVWGSLITWPPLLAVSFILEGSDRIFFTLKNLSWLSVGSILYITYQGDLTKIF